MKFNSEQSGRSMVEMLGVLAIIGVLSVAGIAGYSKAMAKFKVSKAMDQVSMLVANIRTAFSGQVNYAGLDNTMVSQLGLAGKDIEVSTGVLRSPYGSITVAASGTSSDTFTVAFADVPNNACVSIASSDWGYGSGGLQSLKSTADTTGKTDVIPLSEIGTFCGTGNTTLTWTYR